MMLVFLFMLIVVLITRAAWVFNNQQARLPVLACGFAIQLSALLILQWGPAVLYLLVGITLINSLTWLFEWFTAQSEGLRLGSRLVSFVIWVLFLGVLSSDVFGVSFGKYAYIIVHGLRKFSDVLRLIDHSQLLTLSAWFAGALIAVVEGHIAVRFLVQTLNMKPPEKDPKKPEAEVEYNRGRIIGALERLMVFFFVFHGAFDALGFLIAAKGMSRFKQLDNREFAEYFLVGTLSSVIIAGAAALAIQFLLKAWC